MARVSYKRRRFAPAAVQHAVWLYLRFTLGLGDVEEVPAQQGIEVSYGTIRVRTVKFDPKITANLRRGKRPLSPRWHLDEMVCKNGGVRVFLRRPADDEGEVVDLLVQERRVMRAALKLLQQLLRGQPVEPESVVTDRLASYGPSLRAIRREELHRPGRLRENNRAQNSHLPMRRREWKMLGFKSRISAQRLMTTHAAIDNAFDFQ